MWKNKNYKIKRSVIYQSLSSGGLNFPNFCTVVKSLRLSWLGRFLNRTNESWQAIPTESFNRNFVTIDHFPWLKWVVRTTTIYFRKVKLKSLLLLNAGLASFHYFTTSWEQSFNTIYKSTKDNKLRELGYKILHIILVTNKELIRNSKSEMMIFVIRVRLLIHWNIVTFLQCASLQMLNFIMKSYHGFMCPTILLLIFPRSKFWCRNISLVL